MPQQINNSLLLANLALAELKTTMPYIMTSDRSYEMDFMNQTYQSGQTVNVRKMNRYIAGRGRIVTPQATIEETTPIVIGPEYSLSTQFNSQELTLQMTKNPELYYQRYVSPAVQALAA